MPNVHRSRSFLARAALLGTVVMALLMPAAPVAAATGPYLVKDINTSGSASPIDLTAMNGILYFSAKGGGKGRELWRSDGTAAGTRRVKDIKPGSGGSSPWSFVAIGSLLYFSADDGVNGRELWVSDGTGAGTRLVKDINPGIADSEPFGFTLFNGLAYFSAADAAAGQELWRTDGTTAGTTRVKDIAAGSTGSRPNAFVAFAGKLFFTTSAGSIDAVDTLYRTDGTPAGTKKFRDSAGNAITGQGVNWLTVAGSRLFFIRNENELWRTGGTQSLTKRIAQLNAWEITGVGSRAYFRSGEQLWKSDGTSATTKLVADFTNSGVHAPYPFNGKLFFFAHGEPWISDGTAAGTDPVGKQVQGDSNFAVLNSVIYFGGWEREPEARAQGVSASFTPAPTLTLWRSDGTADGTYSVGPPDAHMHSVTAVGDSIYFAANTDGFGTELWRYVP